MRGKLFIKWVFSLFIILFFTACGGGGSGVDSSIITQPTVSSDTNGNMIISGTLSLNSGITTSEAINSITLNGLSLSLPIDPNCRVISTNLPNSIDITENTTLSFEVTLSNECYTINNMTLNATELITYSNSATENKNYSYDITFDNYAILNAYNNLTINIDAPIEANMNETDTFSYQLLDSSLNRQLADENTNEVKVETTDSSKIVLLDENDNDMNIVIKNTPYAQVNFKGVSTGTANLILTATATINGFTVTKSKNISINILEGTVSQCSLAKIILDPSQFIVNQGISQTINIYTLDVNNNPISTEITLPKYLIDGEETYGEFDTNSVTTDSNGKATVVYTPSDNIDSFGGKTEEVILQATNCDINKTLSLVFPLSDTTANLVDKLLINPTSIKVVENLKQTIDIYTINSNNQPISATVKIDFPLDENDEPYGEFDSYIVTTDANGKATVIYSVPDNIQLSNNEINVTFMVDDTNNKSTILTLEPEIITQTAKEYNILLSSDSSLSIDNQESIIVDIVEKDNNTSFIPDENVTEVNITSTNHLIYFDNNKEDYLFTYNGNARKNVDLNTKTISGIEIIHISARIFNGENYVNIEKDFPITIISGAPSAISIVYKDTIFDAPFFYDTYTIHAVDKYGNPAREGSRIYLGAVNGLVKDTNGNELYVERGGLISNDTIQAKFELTNSLYDFSNVENQNTLIVLADEDRMNPSYLGGWIVNSIVDDKTLLFEKTYSDRAEDSLTFVIGNEKRYDICALEPKLVDFDSDDNSYVLDIGGMKEVKLRYPSYMVGKDVYLYVNSYDENRTGVSTRKKLWGTGINANINTSGCVTGANCDVSVFFTVSGSNDPLQNQDFYLSNFYIGSGCGNPVITKSNTSCDGQIIINLNYGDGCSVEWNSIPYEH